MPSPPETPAGPAGAADPPDPAVVTVVVADERAAALRDVCKRYPTADDGLVALDAVSLDVAAAGLVVVCGRTGSGTSTLMRILACLERPDSGEVWVAGADAVASSRRARLELRRTSIGVLLSEPSRNLLPNLDVGANVVWAAKRRTRSVLRQAGIDAHLEMVGLGGAGRRRVAALDDGERQRLALACACAGTPRLVVADDPSARLGRDEAVRLVNAMRDAADGGMALVVASADPIVIEAADLVVELAHGRRIS